MNTLTLDFEGIEQDAQSQQGKDKTLLDAQLDIPGSRYIQDFITPDEEVKIIKKVDASIWLMELSRRVQHYGYKYDYKSRKIDETMHIGELPQWLVYLGKKLVEADVFSEIPDQVIVNEYQPGQGISPHIDCEPCFGDTIASLSLNSTCYMDFTEKDGTEKKSVWLEPRSLVVLKAEARYLWKHAIAKRRTDLHNGESVSRNRRISLTFRKVKWE
jgi:alkylated DNA repair dioxygenase AlkB